VSRPQRPSSRRPTTPQHGIPTTSDRNSGSHPGAGNSGNSGSGFDFDPAEVFARAEKETEAAEMARRVKEEALSRSKGAADRARAARVQRQNERERDREREYQDNNQDDNQDDNQDNNPDNAGGSKNGGRYGVGGGGGGGGGVNGMDGMADVGKGPGKGPGKGAGKGAGKGVEVDPGIASPSVQELLNRH